MLSIIVCIKQVIDPEAPVSAFAIDPQTRRAIQPKGTPPVLNPFDENALEAALKLKETEGGEITAMSMGRHLALPVLRTSLAVGADKLVLLEDDVFEDLDSYSSAYILAAAIKKMPHYDVILCGRQAADTDAGQVGLGIAEILGIPSITVARKIEGINGGLRLERVLPDGHEVIEVPMPCLITTGGEIGNLRRPSVKALIEASKKPTTVWTLQDLEIDLDQIRRDCLIELSIPPQRESQCELIEGETPEEAGANLLLKLIEAKLL